MTEKFDVVIIGAGCAGAAASIYASRQNLKTLLLDSQGFGGQLLWTDEIENYPGFSHISGPELAEKMKKHVEKFGTEIRIEKVENIEDGEIKKIKTESNEYEAKTVILTMGADHRKLDVEEEEKLRGRGVSYCAVCDGNFFKDQKVAVIGGGSTALEYAKYMQNLAEKVYLIHRRQEFGGEKVLVNEVKENKVEFVLDTICTEIIGDEKVEKIKIKNKKTGKEKELDVSGVFIAVGIKPNNELAKKLGIELNEKGYIKTDEKMRTNKEGIFAAGDITGWLAQIATAVGQGAVAGLEVYNYIKSKKQ